MASFKNLVSTTSAQISSGGTITGDLVINGDLQVDGGGSLSFDEIVQGTSTITVTDNPAFLVEKADGTDVFIVDTTNSRVGIGGTPTQPLNIFHSSHAIALLESSGTDSASSVQFKNDARTYQIGVRGSASDSFIIRDSTATTDRLTIKSDGEVLITPSGANLDVSGAPNGSLSIGSPSSTLQASVMGRTTSNATALHLFASATDANTLGDMRFNVRENNDSTFATLTNPAFKFIHYTTDLVTILRNGLVGIGVSPNADTPLHIHRDSSSTQTIFFDNDGTGRMDFVMRNDRSTEGSASHSIFFDGADDGGNNTRYATIENHIVDNADASEDGKLVFSTMVAGTDTETLNITGGNVGIGTATPEERIHSTGAIVSTGVNDTGATAGTERAFIDLVSNKARIGHFRGTTSAGSGGLQFYTDSVERARIDASGLLNLGNSPSVSKNSHVGSTANGMTISGAVAPTLSLWDSDDANNTGHFFQIGTDTSLWSYNGVLKFLTGTSGTERMRIDSSGDLQLQERLTFSGTNDSIIASSITPHSNGFIYITGGSGGLVIGDDATSSRIQIMNDAEIKFEVNGSERMRIDANSRISLSNNDSGGTGGQNSTSSNTIIGYKAGNAVASGTINNTFIGHNAGLSANDAVANVVVGTNSADALTTGDHNVALGYFALSASTDVDSAIAIGSGAMESGNVTSDADGSIAIGRNSLLALTSGASNVAVGYQTLDACTTGSQNTAVGESALSGTDDGVSNVAIGNSAMGLGNAGGSNTAVGSQSMVDITGDYNTAVGMQSLFDLTSGVSNIAVGALAMKFANGGESNNVAIGVEAMRDVKENGNTADSNIALGSLAMTGGTLGGDFIGNIAIGDRAMDATDTNAQTGTIAIGHHSLSALTSGAGNTAVGYTSGADVTTGANNTFVGYQAGNSGSGDVTGGQANTIIGSGATANGSGAINRTAIGRTATAVADNSVTLGNASVTAVYMAQDSGATVHCAGINFSATQSAPDAGTSSSEVLSSYEEGTWEASFTVVGSGSVTAETSNNTCWYKKIGSVVHCGGRVYVDSVSSPSGQIYITGIPFNTVDGAEGSDLSTGSVILYDPASDTTGYVGIELAVGQQGFLMREGAGLASGVVGIADHFDANTLVGFQMTYPTTI